MCCVECNQIEDPRLKWRECVLCRLQSDRGPTVEVERVCCVECNQIEDPRLKWREAQERMLKEYLADANQDLAVCTKLFSIIRL